MPVLIILIALFEFERTKLSKLILLPFKLIKVRSLTWEAILPSIVIRLIVLLDVVPLKRLFVELAFNLITEELIDAPKIVTLFLRVRGDVI